MRLFWAAALVTLGAHAATRPIAFNAQRVYPFGPRPNSVAVGDFNNDGKPDLAVTLAGANTIAILLGNGHGAFQHPVSYAAGSEPDSVSVGDFN